MCHLAVKSICPLAYVYNCTLQWVFAFVTTLRRYVMKSAVVKSADGTIVKVNGTVPLTGV